VVCSRSALEGLLKRTSEVKGAYFSFCDLGGQQLCAAMKGETICVFVPYRCVLHSRTHLRAHTHTWEHTHI